LPRSPQKEEIAGREKRPKEEVGQGGEKEKDRVNKRGRSPIGKKERGAKIRNRKKDLEPQQPRDHEIRKRGGDRQRLLLRLGGGKKAGEQMSESKGVSSHRSSKPSPFRNIRQGSRKLRGRGEGQVSAICRRLLERKRLQGPSHAGKGKQAEKGKGRTHV